MGVFKILTFCISFTPTLSYMLVMCAPIARWPWGNHVVENVIFAKGHMTQLYSCIYWACSILWKWAWFWLYSPIHTKRWPSILWSVSQWKDIQALLPKGLSSNPSDAIAIMVRSSKNPDAQVAWVSVVLVPVPSPDKLRKVALGRHKACVKSNMRRIISCGNPWREDGWRNVV